MPMIRVDAIKVDQRQRSLRREKVAQLAESIDVVGLLHPIAVTPENRLISGLHRLEAHRLLGLHEVECRVLNIEEAKQELVEIDENVARAELNDIELGEHILRREAILADMGLQAKRGDNRHTVNGLNRAKDVAERLRISVGSIVKKKRIARELASDVKERLVITKYAFNTTGLLKLAKLDHDTQRMAVDLLLDGPHRELGPAITAALFESRKKAVNTVLKRYKSGDVDNLSLLCGDFRHVGRYIEAKSVDCIWCDPPYANEAIYDNLGRFAERVLKPGGSCFAYCGQSRLPQVLQLMGQHLRYWWILSLNVKNGGKVADHGRQVFIEWKPIVWFTKGDHRQVNKYVPDNPVASSPEFNKELHRWEQDVSTPDYYIFNTTEPDSVVCDPFMGTGSTGVAALRCGRRFIGIEKEKDTFESAKMRLNSEMAVLSQNPQYLPK